MAYRLVNFQILDILVLHVIKLISFLSLILLTGSFACADKAVDREPHMKIAAGSFTGVAQNMFVREDGEFIAQENLTITHCEFHDDGSLTIITPVETGDGASNLGRFVLEPQERGGWSQEFEDGRMLLVKVVYWSHMFSLEITLDKQGRAAIKSHEFYPSAVSASGIHRPPGLKRNQGGELTAPPICLD